VSASLPLFGAEPEEQQLLGRLQALGLTRVTELRLTGNRSVMVSLTPNGILRLHRGYVLAPDSVLRAVVRFVAPATRRTVRRAAERELLRFEPERFGSGAQARRHDAPRPGDVLVTDRLARRFAELNASHFGGALPSLPIRLSGRMRTRLGQLCLDPQTLEPFEITLSRRHLELHGWDEAEHTLLHEMVHLWQWASGYPVDHGPLFRSRARAVGVAPSARRRLRTPLSRNRAALYD
jgi:hypothetical protein